MAVSDTDDQDFAAYGVAESDLDGHTVEELWDYLDRGETPTDPTIDESPGCQIALEAMRRLRAISWTAWLEDQAAEPEPSDAWVRRVLGDIGIEAKAGRDVPYRDTEGLAITEGAIRGLVRAAGDGVDGVVVGRVGLDGEVARADAPVRVTVAITMRFGRVIAQTAGEVRAAVSTALRRQTDLNVVALDIEVQDVHVRERPLDETAGGQ